MHYRNGRAAQNGDKVVKLDLEHGNIVAAGVLVNATAGNDYCNGYIVPLGDGGAPMGGSVGACLIDCLHVEDVATLVGAKGLAKRPEGK